MEDARSLRQLALEMKSKTGLLTDDEAQELRRTPRLVGGEEPNSGPLVVGAALTQAQWEAEFGPMRHPETPAAWAERNREVFGDDADL